MEYRFVRDRDYYEHFASGRVLYHRGGTTSFPVRLASEVYQRCKAHLKKQGGVPPFTLYDPCCGGAYLLTVLGYLHGLDFKAIYASDIDEQVIELAEQNLSLLTLAGLDLRIAQIRTLMETYGKDSHSGALESAGQLRSMLTAVPYPIPTHCFNADITHPSGLNQLNASINMVITDIPYGSMVQWGGTSKGDEQVSRLLDNLLPLVNPPAVVAIISPKKTVVQNERYRRLERFNVGKRQVVILGLF